MTYTGRIEAVYLDQAGSEVTAVANIGDTVIAVAFPVDFDENGGTFTRRPVDSPNSDTTVYAYTAIDTDAETITLAAALTAAWSVGDVLNIEPASTEARALVRLDDSTDEPAVDCRVSHVLRPLLSLGGRDPGTGESVILEDTDNEWTVTDLVGQDPAIVSADFIVTDGVGTVVAMITAADDFDAAGNTYLAIQGPVGFTQPFQVLDPNTLTIETWHDLGGLTGTGVSFSNHRYRLTPDGEVEFDFSGQCVTANSGGSYTFPNALPSNYRPAVQREYPIGVGPSGMGRIHIDNSTGNVQITMPSMVVNNTIGAGFHMPRD